MKECDKEDQVECDQYEAKESRPGYLDLTCLYWRRNFLGKGEHVCDAPPKKDKKL